MALKTIGYCILVIVLLQIRWATGSEILVSNVDELVAATQETADRLTIKLATGSYELSRQLVLKSGTKLIGAGIDKTFITHRSEWKASPKSLPDPEVRIQGLDSESYLIRMTDNSANVEVSGLTLIGPQVHGAIFGLRPKNFLMDHFSLLRMDGFSKRWRSLERISNA